MTRLPSRREILTSLAAVPALSFSSRAAPATVELRSPDDRIRITLVDDRITVRVTYQGATVRDWASSHAALQGYYCGMRTPCSQQTVQTAACTQFHIVRSGLS